MGHMSLGTVLETNSKSSADTLRIAGILARKLKGGEVIELIGDVGAGKTEFVRGLAKGTGSKDVVQSPTFTINRIYKGPKVTLHHYDFHRLEDPGVLREHLQESLHDPGAVTVIEWSDTVRDVLPKEKLSITIEPGSENSRKISFIAPGKTHQPLLEAFK